MTTDFSVPAAGYPLRTVIYTFCLPSLQTPERAGNCFGCRKREGACHGGGGPAAHGPNCTGGGGGVPAKLPAGFAPPSAGGVPGAAASGGGAHALGGVGGLPYNGYQMNGAGYYHQPAWHAAAAAIPPHQQHHHQQQQAANKG